LWVVLGFLSWVLGFFPFSVSFLGFWGSFRFLSVVAG
jgi:hypothetical protein